MNLAARIFDDRNRLWSLPLLAGASALAVSMARTPDGGGLQTLLEASIATGIAFVLTAAWTVVADWRAGMPRVPSRAEQQAHIEISQRNIEVLRMELRTLEDGLKNYLAAKKAETEKIQGDIKDLNNDVVLLKGKDPVEALRPQLSAIADKFGELAGVRAVVANLSSKVRSVEALAGQVREVEARLTTNPAAPETAQFASATTAELDARLAILRQEMRVDIERYIAEKSSAVQNSALLEDAMAGLKKNFEAKLAEGAQELLKSADANKLADILGEKTNDRFESMERRMTKLSKTIEALTQRVEDMRWIGADDGIPSIYRGVQGLDANDPNKGMKSGCLSKLFQANVQLRKLAAAA